MNSDLLTRWTAIIANMAFVIGLSFVGLECRNNARAAEAERISGFYEGVADVQALWMGSDRLSDILF